MSLKNNSEENSEYQEEDEYEEAQYELDEVCFCKQCLFIYKKNKKNMIRK